MFCDADLTLLSRELISSRCLSHVCPCGSYSLIKVPLPSILWFHPWRPLCSWDLSSLLEKLVEVWFPSLRRLSPIEILSLSSRSQHLQGADSLLQSAYDFEVLSNSQVPLTLFRGTVALEVVTPSSRRVLRSCLPPQDVFCPDDLIPHRDSFCSRSPDSLLEKSFEVLFLLKTSVAPWGSVSFLKAPSPLRSYFPPRGGRWSSSPYLHFVKQLTSQLKPILPDRTHETFFFKGLVHESWSFKISLGKWLGALELWATLR